MKEVNNDLIATHEIIRVLETSLYFSRNIIDKQPDILIITDRSGRIYRINQHAANFLKRAKTDILGQNIDELCTGLVKRKFSEFLEKDYQDHASFSNEDESD
ncbi:MAG: PAS domain-containing protein, partial [Oligoflexus sp.]